jgi:hypothetical protein
MITNNELNMEMSKDLANRLREVLLDGHWMANTNFKEQITNTNWKEAIVKMEGLNTIAFLTFHINDYLKGVLNVFQGGELVIKNEKAHSVEWAFLTKQTKKLFTHDKLYS